MCVLGPLLHNRALCHSPLTLEDSLPPPGCLSRWSLWELTTGSEPMMGGRGHGGGGAGDQGGGPTSRGGAVPGPKGLRMEPAGSEPGRWASKQGTPGGLLEGRELMLTRVRGGEAVGSALSI